MMLNLTKNICYRLLNPVGVKKPLLLHTTGFTGSYNMLNHFVVFTY